MHQNFMLWCCSFNLIYLLFCVSTKMFVNLVSMKFFFQLKMSFKSYIRMEVIKKANRFIQDNCFSSHQFSTNFELCLGLELS